LGDPTTPSDVTAADPVFLLFQVGSSWFALDPRLAQELAAPQRPTPIPRVPDYIPGMIKLRGRAVPLLDVQKFLGLSAAAGDEDTLLRRIVVVSANGMTVGLHSDRVKSLVPVPARALLPADSLPPGRVRDFAAAQVADPEGSVTGIPGVIVVLDVPALLDAARVRGAGALA
jgi:purine-binding chemotaxis protein CheW